MNKQEFLKKHSFTDLDYRNLKRYEKAREQGEINMNEYLYIMKKYGINGGYKLATWILSGNNYEEFLSTLGKEKENEL